MELAALAPMKLGESNSVGRSAAVLGFTSSLILVNFRVSCSCPSHPTIQLRNLRLVNLLHVLKNGFGSPAFRNSANLYSRVDGPVSNHRIFRPIWNQSPLQCVERTLLTFLV